MTDKPYLFQNGAAWEELGGSGSGGGISNTEGKSGCPDLAVDGTGGLVVVWEDTSPGQYQIYLKRWDGMAWHELGNSASNWGVSDTVGKSYAPTLAMDGTGRPVVAWQDDT